MSDYGLRISFKGKDVVDDDDLDMALTSKYALFKGSVSGSSSTTLTDGVQKVLTIYHGFGEVPIAKVHADPNQGGDFSLLPLYWGYSPTARTEFYFTTDSLNLIIYLTYIDDSAGTQTQDVDIRYFIYKDKAKLF